MLFPEADASMLKAWIVKRLENTSDADADVLADYVLALLRHDGDIEDVRKLCEVEIPDFLKEDSSVFVNDVFQAIRYKSYLPGAPPPPKNPPPGPAAAGPMGSATVGQPPFSAPHNGSQKRSWGDAEMQEAGDHLFGGGRAFKQPRRGRGRGGRGDGMNGQRGGGWPQGVLPPSGPQGAPFHPGVPGMPPFDPNNPMDAIIKLQNMGYPLPVPNFAPNGSRAPPQKKRQRCRDYDTKGYCARGHTCMYEHGNDSVFLPNVSFPQQQGEEYDPGKSFPAMDSFNPQNLPQFQPAAMANGPTRPQEDNRQVKDKKQRRGRAPFSADGPNHDRSKTTIVIENIPEEKFSEDEVRGFFSQFGNIVEVSMQPYKRLAIVKYEKWGSANAAWKSPKVIFDNRFVKVFWYKDGAGTLPPSVPVNGSAANDSRTGTPADGRGLATGTPAPQEPEIDMEEFVRQQEEAQKQHEEKMRKKREVEAQRQELEKRHKELLAKQQEEKQRLLAKMAGSSGNGQPASAGGGGTPKPKTQTEALRAQLAALEEEAKSLGIDPEAEEAVPFWTSRGGRGRGGGGGYFPRARGFPPRGYRGAYRARGDNHAAYAAYSLDNRPRKIAVTGMDFTVPEKDEGLRQYLFGIGEFTDIQTSAAQTEITFKDRKTAEKFFYGLSGKGIPGIDGQVELTWVVGSVPTMTATMGFSKTSAAASSASNGMKKGDQPHDGDAGMDDNVDMADASSPHHPHHHHDEPEEGEVDYDVADENDWGIE